jgi:hypothetical protein
VVLAPQEPARQGNQRRYQTQKTDQNGQFKMNAPPGEYKAFAWATVDGSPWLSSEYMRPLAGSGVAVSAREGESYTVELKAIPPED